MDNIVADSSFYIFFLNEIKRPKHLSYILGVYSAHIGPVIKDEIKSHLDSEAEIQNKIEDMAINVSFLNILEQYQISLLATFPTLQKWYKKGEFEVIGMSYLLQERGVLKYLILDDKAPYTFIKHHLRFINRNLTRTFGFLIMATVEDKQLPSKLMGDVMAETEKLVSQGNKPINIDKEIWAKIVKPKLVEAMERYNG